MCADNLWSARILCCCFKFQVVAPNFASLNLAFAVASTIQSATLNGESLTVTPNPSRTGGQSSTLEGKIEGKVNLFRPVQGTNVLVVKVFNGRFGGPYGFYAEGTAITGAGAVSSCPRAHTANPHLRATLQPHTV